MRKFIGAFAFLGAVLVGFLFFVSTFKYEQKRTTASVKNNYDLTCVSSEELSKAIAERIVTGFKSFRKDGQLGLHVGHYIFADSESDRKMACATGADRTISSAFAMNNKKTACQIYPQLRFKFVADGSSQNGEKRQMEIETACAVSTDLSHTETVWIPWDQLAKETPFEGVSQYNVPSKVSVKTKNISDQWPERWILEEIELANNSKSIQIGGVQIRTIAGRPFVFDFK